MSKLSLIASAAVFAFSASTANASDSRFFRNIVGQWSGPGEIVAGKFKGTKFVCTFDGSKPGKQDGMKIDGNCRVGVFSQPMNAIITKKGGGYSGKFLDGQKGEGMDVTGARYTNNRLVASMIRHNLDGITVVNLDDPNRMNVTISVKHGKNVIPVIGMNLVRKTDKIVTGSITQ
jgi:hypothetical protein